MLRAFNMKVFGGKFQYKQRKVRLEIRSWTNQAQKADAMKATGLASFETLGFIVLELAKQFSKLWL